MKIPQAPSGWRVDGYAVRVFTVIDMRTVGPTERSAMVNGLAMLFGVMPMNDWSDDEIKRAWETESSRALRDYMMEAHIVPVGVSAAPSPPPDSPEGG